MRRSFFGLIRFLDDLAERVIFDLVLGRWRLRSLVLAVVVAALAFGGTPQTPAPTPADAAMSAEALDGGKLLFKRAWIDKKPKDYREKFTMYAFTDEEIEGDLYFGFSLNGIPVKYMVELHGFRVKGDKLHFWFPADDSRSATGYKVTKEKHGEFDLKLVIEKDPRHGGKSHTYYSKMEGRLEVPGLSLSTDLERRLTRSNP